ncbi:MAG TPA: family 10 glycosylhydrolase [Bacteroidales bacterium]|nr:family 10 glycosylhydrolase [Bacteroidales bacterium]
MKRYELSFLLLVSLFQPFVLHSQTAPIREMRAVWIATVENIDWPSSQTLTTEQQKNEMISLLDLVKDYHLNTVVFQIRPCADAFYSSSFEPWSQWLTGTQGKAPDPFYDPLEFAISECRKRGIDIHVWLNPYRAVRDTSRNFTSPSHITNTHPELFIDYGSTRYFNPSLPETRDHVSRIVADITRRYDIDAIHMDDYFYPYRIAGAQFPDDSSFNRYHGTFLAEQRDDWRRHNVDLIIQQIRDSIKAIKPWVEFGISPFGVWRNAARDSTGSATRAGQTNYDDLFADILKWQKEGWIDYVVPQLYWHIGFEVADYAVLARWWNDHAYGCPLYLGQAFYRIDKKSTTKAWRKAIQITDQVQLNRRLRNISGSMFFSAKYLRTNPRHLKEKLLKEVYRYPALNPVNNRITPIIPASPVVAQLRTVNDSIYLEWSEEENAKNYVIYKFRHRKKRDYTNPSNLFFVTSETSLSLKRTIKNTPRRWYYVITSQSNTNTESEPVDFSELPYGI